ncbi:protein canopy 4-like [Elysia marginata]|uniref:Protein canopy 4-like n=1 Tax=Elysia marginata TaxID=1093978 RepID=A0AAV4HR03_9GAST|nr:protein canopy 4-like [Elysia marginata]
MHFSQLWLLIPIVFVTFVHVYSSDEEKSVQDDPHRDPSLCEVCKYLATELKGRLDETGKTHDVIETGYGLDQKKKKKEYKKTELRLIEALNDPHVCEKILEYNVHAERKGSLRFAKGRSQTMETLHNLVVLKLLKILKNPLRNGIGTIKIKTLQHTYVLIKFLKKTIKSVCLRLGKEKKLEKILKRRQKMLLLKRKLGTERETLGISIRTRDRNFDNVLEIPATRAFYKSQFTELNRKFL